MARGTGIGLLLTLLKVKTMKLFIKYTWVSIIALIGSLWLVSLFLYLAGTLPEEENIIYATLSLCAAGVCGVVASFTTFDLVQDIRAYTRRDEE